MNQTFSCVAAVVDLTHLLLERKGAKHDEHGDVNNRADSREAEK